MTKMNRKVYWALSCTWGILMTLAGLIAAAWLLLKKVPIEKNQYGYAFRFGKGWGGLSLGPIALVCEDASQHTLNHEFGHSIQNCEFGPIMVFITFASVFRYHYRNWVHKHYPSKQLPPYDAIWFEGGATKIGNFYKGEQS